MLHRDPNEHNGDSAPGAIHLQLQVEPKGGYHLVHIRGDLDSPVAELARQRLEEVVEEGPSGRLVLDVAESPFVDSAGLGSLVAIYKRCQARGGSEAAVILLHPSYEFRELLRLTQLDGYLLAFAGIEEARARFPWLEPTL